MSTVKTNNVQIGQSLTATNNFTWYQPSSPDGTVRLGNGNSGSVTDLVTLTSAGNLGIGTSSPQSLLHLNVDGTALRISRGSAIGFLYNTGTSATDITRLQSNGGSVQLYTTGGTATLDSSGNLGLGVTPSGWDSTYKAMQLGSGGNQSAIAGQTNTNQLNIVSNGYFNGTNWIYGNSVGSALYRQSINQHQWFTAPSGTAGNAISFTQAMTLDASGNLGIGVTNPSEKLVVGGRITFGAVVADADVYGLYVSSSTSNSTTLSSYGATNICFRTNAAERARIDSSGNLLVGTTSNTYSARAIINGTALGTAPVLHTQANYNQHGWRVNANFGARSDGTYGVIENTVSGPIYVSAYSQGVVLNSGATTWASNSDERLKTEIEPFTDALEKIISLRCGTGRYLSDSESVSRSFLIAQDVQKVLPEAVFVADDDLGTLTLAYTDTIPLLVAAIKELSAELNELKQRIK